MGEKTLIDDYREQVRQIMLKATKENGEPKLTEKEVKDILTSFSDEDLAFGMPFNTPEETAAFRIKQRQKAGQRQATHPARTKKSE